MTKAELTERLDETKEKLARAHDTLKATEETLSRIEPELERARAALRNAMSLVEYYRAPRLLKTQTFLTGGKIKEGWRYSGGGGVHKWSLAT